MHAATPIAVDVLTECLRGAREREAARQAGLADRRAAARKAAEAVAALLKEQFGATRVVVFGSLVSGVFDEASDIDLVVQGVPPGRFYRGWTEAARLARGFELDLVAMEEARPWLSDLLAVGGVDL